MSDPVHDLAIEFGRLLTGYDLSTLSWGDDLQPWLILERLELLIDAWGITPEDLVDLAPIMVRYYEILTN